MTQQTLSTTAPICSYECYITADGSHTAAALKHEDDRVFVLLKNKHKPYSFTSGLFHSSYSKHSYKEMSEWSLTLKAIQHLKQKVSLSVLHEVPQQGQRSISMAAATEYTLGS